MNRGIIKSNPIHPSWSIESWVGALSSSVVRREPEYSALCKRFRALSLGHQSLEKAIYHASDSLVASFSQYTKVFRKGKYQFATLVGCIISGTSPRYTLRVLVEPIIFPLIIVQKVCRCCRYNNLLCSVSS